MTVLKSFDFDDDVYKKFEEIVKHEGKPESQVIQEIIESLYIQNIKNKDITICSKNTNTNKQV